MAGYNVFCNASREEAISIQALVNFFRSYSQFLRERALPFIIAFLVLLGIYNMAQMSEPLAQDYFMQETAKPAHQSKVTLLLIDDQSLSGLRKKFGQPPWPRTAYLEIFQKLKEYDPAVIVFDSVFTTLDPEADGPIIEEMKKIDNLVMGHAINYGSTDVIRVPAYYHLNLGVVNTTEGTVRTIQPIFQQLIYRQQEGVQGIFPSLSLAAVVQLMDHESRATGQQVEWVVNIYEENNARFLTISPNGDMEKGKKIPLDEDGNIRLRWASLKPSGVNTFDLSHNHIPICRLFNSCETFKGELTPKEIGMIRDHIVVIGASAAVYRDFSTTPMSATHLGADIHATAMDNIYLENTLKTIPDWQNWILFFCIPFILTFYLRIKLKSLFPTFLYTFALMIFFLWLGLEEFRQGVIIDVITPEIFMIVGFASGTFFKYIQTMSYQDRQVKALEKNLSQLVSKAVFNEIQKMEYVLKTSGQRMDITSMFVDLRNFTTLSEHLSPTEVTDMLNEFYTEVEKAVFEYRGHIDKFMGDGVLVIYGAPLPSPSHARDALASSEKIIETVLNVIEKWDQEKDITRTIGVPLNVGISMSSGNVFAGFLGTPSRLEYTAVGDTVNLCVRLQEQTKTYKCQLIVSEYTAELLTDEQREGLHMLGEVRVRGREMPLKIFTYERYMNQPMAEKTFDALAAPVKGITTATPEKPKASPEDNPPA